MEQELIRDNYFCLTEDEKRSVDAMPEWKRLLFWASKVDPNKVYEINGKIWHGERLIGKLKDWAGNSVPDDAPVRDEEMLSVNWQEEGF